MRDGRIIETMTSKRGLGSQRGSVANLKSVAFKGRRVLGLVVFATIALSVLTGCQPNPAAIMNVQPANAFIARLTDVNNSGEAVGWFRSNADSMYRVYEYNFSTNTTTDLSNVPPSSSYPDGAVFGAEHGVSVNASGDVLASIGGNPALYDPSTGEYTSVPCWGSDGLTKLSNNGNVACSNSVYNLNSGVTTPVSSPAGCSGNVTDVTDTVAVGMCTAGTEPYFVTDLATGVTAGFGASEGFFDRNYDNYGLCDLSNNNWVVLCDSLNGDNTSSVVDVTGANPIDVQIGGKTRVPELVAGASDNGRLAINPTPYGCTSGCGVVIADPKTNKMIGLDAPTGEGDGMVPFGLNDSGQVVGVANNGQAFVGTVPMP